MKNIKIIGFDWDGTLVDSLQIKAKAFAKSTIELIPAISNLEEEVEKFYLNSTGNPRIFQLQKLLIDFQINKSISQFEIKQWSDHFTSLYNQQTLPLFKNTLSTLQTLKKSNYILFIGSSVPQNDLNLTIKKYPELDNIFSIIMGSSNDGIFRKGLPYLSKIKNQFNIEFNQILFIGDSPIDIFSTKAANAIAAGIYDSRVPKHKELLAEQKPSLLISDLAEILNYLELR